MDRTGGTGQSWPLRASHAANNFQGANSSSDPLIERPSGRISASDDDGLGISMPQAAVAASFIPRDPQEYPTPTDTPRADRPLLSSPGLYASPQFLQQHQFSAATPYGGGAAPSGGAYRSGPQHSSQARSFSATGPAPSTTKPHPTFEQHATMGKEFDDDPGLSDHPQPEEQPPHPYQYSPYGDPNAIRMAAIDLGNQPGSGNMGRNPDGDDMTSPGFVREYTKIAHECPARDDIHLRRWSWFPSTVLFLSVYSTCLSTMWLVVAIVKPTWWFVSSSPGAMEITTATLLATLFAKTIEMSFVTVFVSFLGQVLSRRAFSKLENGVTLAELTMRNWVIQPGALLTHGETIRYSGKTVLGVLTLVATLAATFYTTASDAMVSPKLTSGGWHTRSLSAWVKTQYANVEFASSSCKTPIRTLDPLPGEAGRGCLNVHYSGNSYHNLMEFMAEWEDINTNGSSKVDNLALRPRGKANLFPNTTMVSQWIETEHSNITANHEKHARIVNNVTLAMPHAGVYFAATDPMNRIPQPQELGGTGEYEVRAAVVSPVVNVKCIDMTRDELAPLVYTTWPNAKYNFTMIPGQRIAHGGWKTEVDTDVALNDRMFNRTVVDDIMEWGKAYNKWPPLFPMYPSDYNIITYNRASGGWTGNYAASGWYVLTKRPDIGGQPSNYTLCGLHSWLTPKCSTKFIVSGTRGGRMEAHCEDPNDEDRYDRVDPGPFDQAVWRWGVQKDWYALGSQLDLAINLNGGVANNNASNARLLTLLAVSESKMPTLLPSMAEALAVLVSSTLVTGAVDATLDGAWNYDKTMLGVPVKHGFQATVQTQGYQSTHADAWQGIFYPVLAAVVLINLLCFFFLIGHWRGHLLTDYTEPSNLFGVALMSPPSAQLRGCCGGGPQGRDLVIPWRVSGFPDDDDAGDDLCTNNHSMPRPPHAGRTDTAYTSGTEAGPPTQHHFFFQEAMDRPWRGKWKGTLYGESPSMHSPRVVSSSYKKLSNRKSLL